MTSKACFGQRWHVLTLLLCLASPLLVVADVPWHTNLTSYQAGELGVQPMQTFHSAPHIRAPIYQVNTFNYDKSDHTPYIFLTGNYSGRGQGPSIVSAKDLSLIWAEEEYEMTQHAQSLTFKGQPVIAAFSGDMVRMWNQHYEQYYNIPAQVDPALLRADNHECFITDEDTFVLIYSKYEDADLEPIGGRREDCARNCYMQEIDPATRKVLFEFNTLDFFGIADTIWPFNGTGLYDMNLKCFDFCHMNSIEKTAEGDFLVSYRHLNSVILVDGQTRKVKWAMGGKKNQFKDITVNGTATFAYQHQPRFTAPNRIIMFDNSQLPNQFCPGVKDGRPCSRGLEIEFDTKDMTMKMVDEWYHPQSIASASRGGVQRLPNGGVLIAWGQNAMYTEYDANGEVVLDFQRSRVLESDHGHVPTIAYRATKGDWVGKPSWGPNISSNAGPERDGEKRIYVSWNGATEVTHWALLLSQESSDLDGPEKVAAQRERAGFETEIYVPLSNFTYARVAALDKKGNVIGSTPAVHIESGLLHPLNYTIASVKKNEKKESKPKSPIAKLYAPTTKLFNSGVDCSSIFFWLTAMLSITFLLQVIPVFFACLPRLGADCLRTLTYLLRTRRVVYKQLAHLLKIDKT